jgi:hypothetical protein
MNRSACQTGTFPFYQSMNAVSPSGQGPNDLKIESHLRLAIFIGISQQRSMIPTVGQSERSGQQLTQIEWGAMWGGREDESSKREL